MQGECLVKSSNRKIYIAGYADAETTLKNAVMHQPVIGRYLLEKNLTIIEPVMTTSKPKPLLEKIMLY
jgi:hypothetical protein